MNIGIKAVWETLIMMDNSSAPLYALRIKRQELYDAVTKNKHEDLYSKLSLIDLGNAENTNALTDYIFHRDTVSDIDGNVYKTIVIGKQTWMAENLRTTRLNDGTPINAITKKQALTGWQAYYSWYQYDESAYTDPYGSLYNWYAVDSRRLCPSGWHVPSLSEWKELVAYLGDHAGGKLKENGLAHWAEPNEGATDEREFSALPGGTLNGMSGQFNYLGYRGIYWSALKDPDFSDYILTVLMTAKYDIFRVGEGVHSLKYDGASVRCVKD
jgi:uncharacterized protein (TIGR02145 family)